VNVVLKETVGTHLPVDVTAILSMRFSGFNERLMRAVSKQRHDEKRQMFADAIWIVEQEYLKKYGKAIEVPYATLGARYLLMPNNAFSKNVKLYDFNLIELMKDVYTTVCVEDMAYHLVDECDCSAKKFSLGVFERMRWCDGVGNTNADGLRQLEIEVVKETLQHPKGTFSKQINDLYKITGHKAETDTVMLIYY